MKKADVVRQRPVKGDVVILLGGDTGRDGCGGATGSSKAHTEKSVEVCGAEVQKGNPPTERKLQRLFRNPEASSLILKCNDFGAGGVSVAIGELADSLDIYLDRVPKKYDGLDGTELETAYLSEPPTGYEDGSKYLSALPGAQATVTIAYEPVWSIGPGKTPAGKDYITKVARLVKDTLGDVPVVYGGGLKMDNAAMLASIPEIDGGLIALTRFSGDIGFYSDEYLGIVERYLGNKKEV